MTDIEEMDVDELNDRVLELEDENYHLTRKLDLIEEWLHVIPNEDDISVDDANNINAMLKNYFHEHGIRYEDYT